MAEDAPEWLLVMRTLTGVVEAPGAKNNPKILAMRDEIAKKYPEMKSYCDQYKHDSTPWCGLTAAYCLAVSGIRPPFGKTDTERFLWARSFAGAPNLTNIPAPRLGCVVVMTRSGGGHVTLYERIEGASLVCRGGNQSDSVCESKYAKSTVLAYMWPKEGIAPSPSPEPGVPILDIRIEGRALVTVDGKPVSRGER